VIHRSHHGGEGRGAVADFEAVRAEIGTSGAAEDEGVAYHGWFRWSALPAPLHGTPETLEGQHAHSVMVSNDVRAGELAWSLSGEEGGIRTA
jgi:hypothetical protein